MAISITADIRQALQALERERKQLDRQIEALQRVLAIFDSSPAEQAPASKPTARKAARRGMSAASRRAASERMKAYWAKRRKTAGKGQAAAK
ncbi:MAG: hypothetical protein EHM24_28025 [Acidobacteria bacterium]|nr:MAG: hypothetical protein EHM24_28025 [Acidobacteriota bacterium]